jgi:hypothetical protein
MDFRTLLRDYRNRTGYYTQSSASTQAATGASGSSQPASTPSPGLVPRAPRRTPAPVAPRSSLTSFVEDGQKQYMLGGRPIGAYYPVKSEATQSSMPVQPRPLISKTGNSSIFGRRNPDAPFITKLARATSRETQERVESRNELARLVNKGPLAQHFAVEIFAGEVAGDYRYVARRVQGFPLNDSASLAAAQASGELEPRTFARKMNELSAAVTWLNDSGFFHNDINMGNIMYDRVRKSMVLVDFEEAGKSQPSGPYPEHDVVDAIKLALAAQARSSAVTTETGSAPAGRPPSP